MTDFRREIDFRTGVLRSELTWHTRAGGTVRVVSQRLVSLEHRHLAVLRLSLELLEHRPRSRLRRSSSTARMSPSAAPGGRRPTPAAGASSIGACLEPVLQTHPDAGSPGGGTVTLGYRCVGSGMTIAAAYRHAVAAGGKVAIDTELTGDRAATTIRLDAAAGDTVTLTKYVAYHAASQVPEPVRRRVDRRARRPLRAARSMPPRRPDGSRRSPSSRPGSTGSGRAPTSPSRATTRPSRRSAGTCSSSPRPRPGPTGAASPPRGSRLAATSGHYFWDTEIYVVPFLTYTNPDAARDAAALPLPHAARGAPAGPIELTPARRAVPVAHDQRRGGLGLLRRPAPRSTTSTPTSRTPRAATSTATGDIDFLNRDGVEILVETARMWADLGF